MNIKTHKPEIKSVGKKQPNKNLRRYFPAKSQHTIKHLKNLKMFNRMLYVTLPILFPNLSLDLYSAQLGYILHLYQSKGPEYVVRYLKATHESLEALVLRMDLDLRHEKVSIGKDRDYWPKWLGSRLKSKILVDKDIMSIKLVLTLCSTRRLITIPTRTNLASITALPGFDSNVVKHIATSTKEDTAKLARKFSAPEIGSMIETIEGVVVTTPTPGLEVSLKSGPNGITFFNFPWDRAAILANSNLIDSLQRFAALIYSGSIADWFDEKLSPYEKLVDSNRQLNVGKISLTFEGGKLKPRIFAMVDSFTQSLLKPYHSFLMHILRNINEDCTFDHSKVVDVARKMYSKKHTFYGFADLSNASDAIPKELYVDAGNDIRPGLGDAWVSIFDRDFCVPKSVKDFWNWNTDIKFQNTVRYNTGQPMGALSSWPKMALVHHRIVWTAFGSRYNSRGKYLLLGDDIVIFDAKAYYKYCDLLEDLAIPYTSNISTVGFEFAKRVFHSGKEITGAYTAALWASRNAPELFAMEWRTLASRGYSSGTDLHNDFRKLLKVSRIRFIKCKLLMSVPYGTEVSMEALAKFTLGVTGRSDCLLDRGNTARLVESIKAFRQASSVLLQQSFQKLLDNSKQAVHKNAEAFRASFLKLSGLADQFSPIMQVAIEEYLNDGKLRIRYLERDLKITYLGGTIRKEGPDGPTIEYVSPLDRILLRPNLPQLPREINFKHREKHAEQLKFRAEHHIGIIRLLRG